MSSVLDDIPRNEKIPKTKLTLSQICCRIGVCLLITTVSFILIVISLFVIAWFTLGAELWDITFGVDIVNDCAPFRGNTPSNFTLNYNCWPLIDPTSQWPIKFSPYYVNETNYEFVTYQSRDASWIPFFGM